MLRNPLPPRSALVPELEHDYGRNVHILSDPFLAAGLARASAPGCAPPELQGWLRVLYGALLRVAVNAEFRRARVRVPTRMAAAHPEAVLDAEVPDPEGRAVVVSVLRGGGVPAQACHEALAALLRPDRVRQDFVMAQRTTGAGGAVTGTAVMATKVGGDVEGADVLVPDPMGATGSTLLRVLEEYRGLGAPRSVLALHLVVTPEFLRRVRDGAPGVRVFALRLDRGLSPPDVLRARPGARWDEERGLDAHGYVVPGMGGIGEALNGTPG